MMKKNLLYIEDDREIGNLVTDTLHRKGYDVQWFTSGEHALNELKNIDLVILDIMLPKLDGFTLGQRIKNKSPEIPILFLSARTTLNDKIHGLNFADDYLTKPFHPDELVARIEVLLRRFGKSEITYIHLAHLYIDIQKKQIIDTRTNEEIHLTAKQYHIFVYFLRHPNQILTKEQIYEAIWERPYLDGDKTVMVHIRHLREKIEQDPNAPRIIETIRGIGYRVKQ
jgi:DNA-binding response OmpR family regulator